MGNRAIVTVKTTKSAPAVYLHWNGGPESILAFLEAAKQLGVRSPASDPDYFLSRFGQIVANFFGGTTSVGFGQADKQDDGNNGRYYIGGKFEIVKRQRPGPMSVEELDAEQRERYRDILVSVLEINRPIFEREK